MSNEKKTQDMADRKTVDPKKGGELSLLLDMFGPKARQWAVRGTWLLVGLLIAVLVVYQIRASRDRKIARAEERFAAAETPEELARIAADNEGKPLEFQARLAAAQKLYEEGRYTEAGEEFARCAAATDNLVALRGIAGQAHVAEAQAAKGEQPDKTKLAEAMDLYAKTAGKAATMGLTGSQVDAIMGQARCEAIQGNLDKAREVIESAEKLLEAPDQKQYAFVRPRIKGSLRSLDTRELASPAPEEPEDTDEGKEPEAKEAAKEKPEGKKPAADTPKAQEPTK